MSESSEKLWRCFHCDEVCRSEVDARNHFGSTQGAEPACTIKAAGEFALLDALRNAEERLQRYAAEDSDVLRAMYSMQSDHQKALRSEEERGYAKGVADMRSEIARLREALELLYSETAEYIEINNLGPVHWNRSMQLARAALASADGKQRDGA